MIREVKHCTKCKTEENLIVYNKSVRVSGDVVIYYMCRVCNAERKRRWYHNGNQHKSAALNRRYKIRKEMDI